MLVRQFSGTNTPWVPKRATSLRTKVVARGRITFSGKPLLPFLIWFEINVTIASRDSKIFSCHLLFRLCWHRSGSNFIGRGDTKMCERKDELLICAGDRGLTFSLERGFCSPYPFWWTTLKRRSTFSNCGQPSGPSTIKTSCVRIDTNTFKGPALICLEIIFFVFASSQRLCFSFAFHWSGDSGLSFL